jgi:hypothetical protein
MALDDEKRYTDLIGPPSMAIKTLANIMVARVEAFKIADALRPKSPRTFPCKRYVYDGRAGADGRPFRVEYDRMDRGLRVQRGLANLVAR